MKPSERYTVVLNTRTGRTHLWDKTLLPMRDGEEPGGYVCDLFAWDMTLDERGPVDDSLLGPTTWGGRCRTCYVKAWNDHLADVKAAAERLANR